MASTIAIHPIYGTGGDDVISGTTRSDVISGGGGDDTAYGNVGNDEVWGGSGDDLLYGNSGNDILYGSGGPNLQQVSTVTMTDDYPVTVTFDGETAGYRNSFGYYKVNPETGEIYDVDIVWANASQQGSGGDLIVGETQETLDVGAGDQFGVFIVSNGYSYNQSFYSDWDGTGTFEFRNADGSVATLESTNPALHHVAEDGTETEILVQKYHTAAHGDNLGLNPDGLLHTTGILKTDAGTLTLGFEDLYGGGDLDFDDSVFTLDIGVANAQFLNGHFAIDNSDGANGGDDGGIIVADPDDNDTLYGGTGQDELHGRAGNDYLSGGTGSDELHGGSGTDVLHGNQGSDTLYGNSGDDVLYGGNSADMLQGNSGNDTLHGGSSSDEMYGNSGDDTLYGGTGSDVLSGGSGNDLLEGGTGADTISGGSGNDVIHGNQGADVLNGNSGNDFFIGGSGRDIITGGAGVDTVSYADANSSVRIDLHGKRVTGGDHDTINGVENAIGSDHNDWFRGDVRDNELTGGAGDDYIRGTKGTDTLTGGSGSDIFAWRSSDLDGSLDVVSDFSASDGDTLDLSAIITDTPEFDILDYIQFADNSVDTTVQIDTDGSGGQSHGWESLAVLSGVSGHSETESYEQDFFTFG